jgi:hypothetical protein
LQGEAISSGCRRVAIGYAPVLARLVEAAADTDVTLHFKTGTRLTLDAKPGARVRLTTQAGVRLGLDGVAEWRTDARGSLTLQHVPEGVYRLLVDGKLAGEVRVQGQTTEHTVGD